MKEIPNVEVGILRAREIKFHLSGKYKLSTDKTNNLYGQCTVQLQDKELVVKNGGKSFSFDSEITFLPCNLTADSFELENVVIGIDFHWEQKENQQFRGALKLMKAGNEIQAVNILPVENYLYSVISSEMRGDSSLNLLKAHAIISRSWLLAQIDAENRFGQAMEKAPGNINDKKRVMWYAREDHQDFHVCADDHCQRYQGITRTHNPNVIKAVQETAGMILAYDDKICDARYSKCCGGIMEKFENCWEPVEHPYLTNVPDSINADNKADANVADEYAAREFIHNRPHACCNTTDTKILSQVLNDYDLETQDFFRWSVNYDQPTLAGLIRKKSGIDFGQIKNLTALKRGPSGRIVEMQIEGTKKTLIIGKELEIRKWLSESHLYSSAFTISISELYDEIPQRFVLNGAGWGHGVGLCQIGAAVLGAEGYSHKKILNHYYPGAELTKWY